jgi:pantetheine-phosphate adenylyltransferase
MKKAREKLIFRNTPGKVLRFRAISDFELELQMAHTNKTLSNQVETVFLATSNEYSFLSSSVVREIAKLGGPLEHLVPPHITHDLRQRFANRSPASTDA